MPSYSTSRPMWTRGKGPRSGSCRDCWRKKHRRRDDEPIGRRFFSYGGGGTLFLFLCEPSRGTGARPNASNPSAGSRDLTAIRGQGQDRKSTRLNSSHGYISYAVFCLKKKKNISRKLFYTVCSAG